MHREIKELAPPKELLREGKVPCKRTMETEVDRAKVIVPRSIAQVKFFSSNEGERRRGGVLAAP